VLNFVTGILLFFTGGIAYNKNRKDKYEKRKEKESKRGRVEEVLYNKSSLWSSVNPKDVRPALELQKPSRR
jgi:hypothetical protein